MKTPRLEPKPPAIIWGAAALAVLSLVWSGYAITDLMHSGYFGLSVALAGDVGWITVLWAEYRGITIAGWRWAAPLAGWLIAIGVAALLVMHGAEHSRGQAVAGPFVVLVGKVVWTFALAAMKDPTALTPDQETEINSVIRDGGYTARMHHAESDAEIARIRAEARTTMARDEADFQIVVERLNKRAEIDRRTPLSLSAAPAAHRVEPAEPPARTRSEPQAQPGEPPTPQPPIVLASAQAAAPEPPFQPAEPEGRPFGFSAHLTAQSAQRAQSVAKVAELVAQDPGLTSGQVAELLDVSTATAKRYLREARQPATSNRPKEGN